jgi:hypothetical protein
MLVNVLGAMQASNKELQDKVEFSNKDLQNKVEASNQGSKELHEKLELN